jgi:LPXTG-motif cell wall-anchored protein
VITLEWDDTLPDDLSCTVVQLNETDSGYETMLESVDQTLSDDSLSRLDVQLYRIDWESQGEAYTLPTGVSPTVELTLLEEFQAADGMTLTGLVLTTADDVPAKTETLASTIKRAAKATVALAMDDEENEADTSNSESEAYGVELVDLDDQTLSVSLMSSNVVGVAAVSAVRTVTAGYYRRVNSMSELSSLAAHDTNYGATHVTSATDNWNKFVFVFNNGMYALEGITNQIGGYKGTKYPEFKLHKVEVQQVPGNPNYVTITENSTGTVYSPSTMSLANYTLQTPHKNYSGSEGSVFILRAAGGDVDGWFYMRGGVYARAAYSEDLTTNFSDGIRFEYDSERKVFHMYTSEYGYLSTNITPDANAYNNYEGGQMGTLDSVALQTSDETAIVTVKDYLTKSGGGYEVNNSELSIYVYESVTLSIPTVNVSGSNQSVLPRATKPSYSDSAAPSAAVTGTDDDAGYTYRSDGATSNIESLLSGNRLTFEEQQANDGRVVTDKSVIYGDDDYGAIDRYEAGEFSVTLSALGQEWTVSEEETVESPIDVIFLLDFSGSMTDIANTSGTKMRWQATIEATNSAITDVMTSNPDNRVGVVCFSNVAETLLPLGQYALVSEYKTSDGYITYTGDDHATVCTNPALAYKTSSGSYSMYGSVSAYISGMWSATYTQVGLQQVYNEFAKVSGSLTKTLTNGETVTVQRKPVIIFLTDGEPTLGTYNYMDPVNGPRYGIGTSGENGMLGYYTILSANYFKNMTSIHYGTNTAFYSIGVGIKSSGTGSYSVEGNAANKTSYYADDAYRRAVIDPSSANVSYLTTQPSYNYNNSLTNYNMSISYYTASKLLYNLLKGDPTEYIQNIEERYMSDGYGTYYEQWLRGISNPFSNYAYADDSKFYGEFTEKELAEFFSDIVDTVQLINNYGFLLKDDTSVTITDPIGEGMEVKGTPVLSYAGNLYTNPTKTTSGNYVEYTWNVRVTRQESDSKGKNVQLDLSVIKARVYTDADGNQTVKFMIPEEVMPTLYPDLHKSFYYEELPARLIYKVGLKDGATSSLAENQSKIFYTNTYTTENGQIAADTTVTFTPAENNPYYFGATDQTKTVAKGENTTSTAAYSFQEYVTGKVVTQLLGNNGMLTASNLPDLTIKKQWDGVDTEKQTAVTVWLFREKQYVDQDGQVTSVGSIETYGTQSLNADNSWEVTLKNTEYGGEDDTGTYLWKYYVTEDNVAMGNYRAYYTDSSGNLLDYVTRDVVAPDGTYHGLRLYPLSGAVTINNHSGKLTVTKVWSGDEPGADSVTVYIYKRATPVYGSSLTAPKTELFQTVTLSAANHWTYSYDYAYTYGIDLDLLVGCYYDYFVTEEPIDGYAATYTYPSGNSLSSVNLAVGNEAISAYPAVRDVTITNAPNGMTSITVEKTWAEGTAPKPVQVVLYCWIYQTDKETGKETERFYIVRSDHYLSDTYYENEEYEITLDESNGWTYTWAELPLFEETDEYTVRANYYLYEVNQDGYIVTYLDKTGQTIETTEYAAGKVKNIASKFGETIQAAHVTGGTVTIRNSSQVTLPHAGGVGTRWIYLAGLVLMLAAGALLLRKKRTEN